MARQSNIELLRIVATLMILMVHFSGWIPTFFGVESFWTGNAAMDVTRAMLNSMTCIGVVTFVLISGYFSIKPKVRSLLNLFTCLAFFYLGTYLLNCWITGDAVFQHHRVLRSLLAFSHENWFIQCYLFLMLFSPMLNAFVEKVSEMALLGYILVFAACAFYFGCVHDSTYFYFNRGYSVTTFIMVYLIGRYVRLYGEKRLEQVASWKIALVWLSCTALICVWKLFMPKHGVFVSYCSPIQLLSAVSLFLLFARMSFQSTVVNWMGASCLAAYVLHTNAPIMRWMIDADEWLLCANNAGLYLVGAIGICIGVFVVAILLDKIRIGVFKPMIDKLSTISIRKENEK